MGSSDRSNFLSRNDQQQRSRPPANPARGATGIAIPGRATDPPVVASRDLLAGGRELVIRHAGEVYRLRLTANNRLILTK